MRFIFHSRTPVAANSQMPRAVAKMIKVLDKMADGHLLDSKGLTTACGWVSLYDVSHFAVDHRLAPYRFTRKGDHRVWWGNRRTIVEAKK